MKTAVLLVVLLLGCVGVGYTQVRGRPESTPISQTQKAVNRANDLNRRSTELRNIEKFPNTPPRGRSNFYKTIKPRYRKATKDELRYMAPSDSDLDRYSGYVKAKRRGIIKLATDIGCAKDAKIVVASPKCEGYTMPGAGSAYSFRFGSYRMQHLSDLNLKNNTFQALGVLTHGMLVNLGDIPLDGVGLKTNGLQYITKFKPVRDMAGAAKFAGELTKGVKDRGFSYASILPVKPNSTYVLRSIAYGGIAERKVGGILFNELEFDKRKDVIIAFRVVRFNQDKDVTIIWKRLRSKGSPRIKK